MIGRVLLAALALMAGAATASESTIVVGDSTSAMRGAWPEHYAGPTHLKVEAQSGLTLRDFDVPAYWLAGRPYNRVVLMLGINDAAFPSIMSIWNRRAHIVLDDLLARGFDVSVVLPPVLTPAEPYRAVRASLTRAAHQRGLDVYDLMEVWDTSLTTDGVHPGPELAAMIANWMEGIL